MQRNVLVVAEDDRVRKSLAEQFQKRGLQVTQALDGTEAIGVARSMSVDLVVLACRGPAPGVRALAQRIRHERPATRVVPVTCFGAVRSSTELLRFGPDDYLIGVADLADLVPATTAGDSAAIAAAADRGVRSLIDTLDVLVGLLELGDRCFAGSAHRTLRTVRAVAEELGLDAWSVHEVSIAALLRDLGRVGVDGDVLDSTSPYTLEQFEKMKAHVDAGLRLLEHVEYPWKILPVVRHHHERYDGRGYPDGLRGREIPLGARILAVVDAYVALTSDRPHRPAAAPEEAIEQLERNAGTQFDPEIVEILIRIADRRPGVAGGERGRVVLVDDQEDFRELVQLRLLNEGFDVRAHGDLDEAFDALDEDVPDVLVVDPGATPADANALLRRAMDDARLDDVPLVLLSRTDDPVLKLRALRQGVDEFFDKAGDLDELAARIENLVARERRRADPSRTRRRGVAGDLANLSLPEIVQTLAIGTKTACVRLASNGSKGRIWFREGTLIHAKCGKLSGDEAFWELLRWKTGEFVIEHGVRTRSVSIRDDAMYLVMEGLRIQDEESPAADSAVL